MKLAASAVSWGLILLVAACAQTPRLAPAPAPAPGPDTSLATATSALAQRIKDHGEVEASFIYEGRSPFGRGLRSRTLLEASFDGCRMKLSRAIHIWASDRREVDAQRETEVIELGLQDVDPRAILVARTGGYRQAAGYAVTSKYLGDTVEIRVGAVGGAARFGVAGRREATMAELRFMLDDSLVGAQVAKGLMQAADLCQRPRTASNDAPPKPR